MGVLLHAIVDPSVWSPCPDSWAPSSSSSTSSKRVHFGCFLSPQSKIVHLPQQLAELFPPGQIARPWNRVNKALLPRRDDHSSFLGLGIDARARPSCFSPGPSPDEGVFPARPRAPPKPVRNCPSRTSFSTPAVLRSPLHEAFLQQGPPFATSPFPRRRRTRHPRRLRRSDKTSFLMVGEMLKSAKMLKDRIVGMIKNDAAEDMWMLYVTVTPCVGTRNAWTPRCTSREGGPL